MKLATKKQTGLTLVEVVVFVAIFGSALVLLLGSVAYSTYVFKDSQNKLVASHNAEMIMEWLTFQKDKTNFNLLLTKAPPQAVIPTEDFPCPATPTSNPPNPDPEITACPEHTTPVPTETFFRSQNTYCLNSVDFDTANLTDLTAGSCSVYDNNKKKELILGTEPSLEAISAFVRISWKERTTVKKVELQKKFYFYE